MGRWKWSPNGPMWDANDDGPNQVDPPPGMSPSGPQAPQQAPMPPQASGLPTTPGVNGQPVYTGGYDPNSPLYQQGGGGFGQQGGGHYEGIDWDRRWVPDNPTPDQTAFDEMRKQFGPPSGPNVSKGTGMPYMIDNTGGGQSPWMTLGSLGGGQQGGQPQTPYGGGSIFGSLGSLGGALGVNGGNVAPKPSGGIAGAIYNKYPDLFKR